MRPQVSLVYSSQVPIYGQIAAGWALSGVPLVTEDTSKGRIAPGTHLYTSSLSGGRPLVEVSELGQGTRYRAANDAQWIRYELHQAQPFYWRAYAPDGTTYLFGHHGTGDNHTTGCTIISDGYAPLTQTVSAFGDVIDYIYRPGVDGECRLEAITWGHNANAGVGYFAAMKFDYTIVPQPCQDVGSQVSYRTGTKIVTGASRLDAIRVTAFPPQAVDAVTPNPIPANPEHTRTITLTYSSPTADCPNPAQHAAYRALLSIQESAVGVDAPQVTLPAISFEYGSDSLEWNALSSLTPQWLPAHDAKDSYNLGWGYRFAGSNPGWPTVEAMMLDLDGDGLIDRLTNAPFYDLGGPRFCRARWERNLGRDANGTVQFAWNQADPDPAKRPKYINMPTLKWATEVGATSPYASGSYARSNVTLGEQELCALNYQRTGYRNSTFNTLCQPGGTVCPASGYCSNGTDCTSKTDQPGDTFFAWRWFDINGDGKVDLVGSPIRGGLKRYNLRWGLGVNHTPFISVPSEPAIFGAYDACPPSSYSADPVNAPNHPYTMCGGMFPWMVYLNHGRGSFGKERPVQPATNESRGAQHETWGPLPDYILYQPIPLETTAGDSSVTSAPIGTTQGMLDLDGDGYSDAVWRQPYDGGSTWKLFYNNRTTGQLLPYVTNLPFQFATGANWKLAGSTGLPAPKAVEGLFDFNGDGLIDHWNVPDPSCPSCTAHAAFNDGLQFRQNEILVMKPGTNSISYNLASLGSWTYQGARVDSRSVFDVDGDGRLDIAEFPPEDSGILAPRIYFNQGSLFAGNDAIRYDLANVNRIVAARNAMVFYMPTSQPSDTWEIRAGMMDLDGDGIPEAIGFTDAIVNPMQGSVARVPTPRQPLRLLKRIDNGRGAVTTMSYSSMHGVAVKYSDELRTTPRPKWVVQALTVTDSIANTTTTTSYEYTNPCYHADDEGTYGFRGFDEVTTTLPTGAKRVESFSYWPDWSGRLMKTIFVPAPSEQSVTGEVRSIDETLWEQRTLFGGALKTYHATVVDHWTCKNGQNEEACRGNTDTRTRTVETLTPLASTTGPDFITPLMWQSVQGRLQAGATDADGDRVTMSTFVLNADASAYRLRPRVTTRLVQQNNALVIFAKSEQTWDPSYRVKLTDEVWVDDDDSHRMITTRSYDMQTGNATQLTNPRGKITTYTYDSRKLFVTTEDRALWQDDYEYKWEYGTGTKTLVRGPQWAWCATYHIPFCPPGTMVRNEKQFKLDGLGRVLELWDSVNKDTTLFDFQLKKLEYHTYVDSTPTSVTDYRALDETGSVIRYTQQKAELDGHGRPIHNIVYTLGSAPTDQITTFQYRDDGTLASVAVPDPTATDASVVTYTYGFDSLGRPSSLRRPDATDPVHRSGLNLGYDGLTQTSSEVVGDAGGIPAVTSARNDAFGRLVEVKEQLQATPTVTWATTTYSYGPDDEVAQIVDPENVTTTLVHDRAGRRTAITRGTRTWRYTYDANGNLLTKTTPCEPRPACDVAYTTSFTYDDLDRVDWKSVAPRDLTASDLALFGARWEHFLYDYAPNATGRVSLWSSHGPDASAEVLSQALNYAPQGQRTQNAQRFTGAGFSQIVRDVMHQYYVGGARWTTSYGDNASGGTEFTKSRIDYDARGLPLDIWISPDRGISWPHPPTVQTRNVAGVVTRRRTQDLTGSMSFIESNWTYDKLGRVTSQVVQKAPGPTTIVRQDLQYFGNDDPKSLGHDLGTNHKQFDFTFDRRHQLTGVNDVPASGYFTAAYQYGAAGRFQRATEATTGAPGSNILPRDVDYQYTGVDSEHVTALLNHGTSSPMLSYQYDLAGNQTLRCLGTITMGTCSGESLAFLYDGEDRLRRVTKRNASGVVEAIEEYWYDSDARRSIVVKRNGAGSVEELIWFLEDTEAHYNASGTVTHAYSHISLGMPVARVDRTSDSSAVVEYQFHGLASNTIAAVAQDGTINASFSYAPFGEVIEATNAGGAGAGTAAHKRRLNDKYEDDLTSLAYYGARYYDKILMGWTQTDPLYSAVPDPAKLNTPRRANLFQFSLNSPLRYVDPDGREATDYNALYNDAIQQGIRSNLDWPVLAGVNSLISALGIDTGGAALNVVLDLAAVDASVAGRDLIAMTLPSGIYLESGQMQILPGIWAASILVHEGEHFKRGGKPSSTKTQYKVEEFYAISAERDFWNRKLKEGKITPRDYREAMGRVKWVAKEEGVEKWMNKYDIKDIVARHKAGMHWAQAWLPEYFAHVSLFSDVYKKKSSRYHQSLWGMEVDTGMGGSLKLPR
jgi:RHS repeat-associated protein